MTVVIDADILIAFGLADEPLHTQARQILIGWRTTGTLLAAPRLLRSEITAVIRKAVYLERLSYEQGRSMLSQLLVYPVEYHEDDALLKTAFELAHRFNRPRAYDAQYLALATRLSCDFWTADERMYNAIKEKFPAVRWLGSWSAAEE